MRCRELVRAEFERRRQTNPRYSLRRFAQALGLSHSTLSRQLRGARPLQARAVRALADALQLPAIESERLVAEEAAAAVLAAVAAPSFKPDSRHVAVHAGVALDDVNIALTALLRDGRLRMPSAREWVPAESNT